MTLLRLAGRPKQAVDPRWRVALATATGPCTNKRSVTVGRCKENETTAVAGPTSARRHVTLLGLGTSWHPPEARLVDEKQTVFYLGPRATGNWSMNTDSYLGSSVL